jgi:uncharacterized membrane protein (DUF4010 family)
MEAVLKAVLTVILVALLVAAISIPGVIVVQAFLRGIGVIKTQILGFYAERPDQDLVQIRPLG